jgi:hypothetical protein
MFVLGFTGTRQGMTAAQKRVVAEVVHALVLEHRRTPLLSALHGDCVGADADFDAICRAAGLWIDCRPSTWGSTRANTNANAIAVPMRPMARNRLIVADATQMIACPPNFEEIKSGSGTWATTRFTRQAEKPLLIVFPDGTTKSERGFG